MFPLFNKKIYFETLDSTSDYLIRLYKQLGVKSNLVVFANKQEKGRGRITKRWFSDNSSLTFSFSIELNSDLDSWSVNMLVSVVLVKVLKDLGVQAIIKYPNDIFVGNKKIAGILTDVISVRNSKYCIVGVGLNINNDFFPSEIPYAISIKKITSKFINKDLLANNILSQLELNLKILENIKKRYFSQLYGAKKYIPSYYKGKHISVKILDLNSQGFLKISTKRNGTFLINHLDIKFLLN